MEKALPYFTIVVATHPAMKGQRVVKLIDRLKDSIVACLSGFDRLMAKGFLRPLMYAEGAMDFLRHRKVLNKDYKDWAMEQSRLLTEGVERFVQEQTGRGITPIASSHTRKEELAHQLQKERQVETGIIGAWSCVEAGQSYRACFDRERGFPQLRWEQVRCKHLYLYMDHQDYGFLDLRIQTWFPFQIQIALNGREWLHRQLMKAGIAHQRCGNKFLDMANAKAAQRLLDRQVHSLRPAMLERLVPMIFPTRGLTIGSRLDYYWTIWQSEWATDLIVKDHQCASEQMDVLLRQALITGTSDRVLRYLARPITVDGHPYARDARQVVTRVATYHDGARVRHWVGANSVKVYNEQNVIRVESTINDPSDFRVMRRAQDESRAKPKRRLPMRKGLADLHHRAAVSQGINNRLMDHLACCTDATALADVVVPYTRSFTKQGRKVRALEPLGKDRELLLAIGDAKYAINGCSNPDLRAVLGQQQWGKGKSQRQLSARISRHLSLLRAHGLIRKMPRQNRYQLTDAGRRLTTALAIALKASTQELMKIAA
jgi:hypothetical protein